MGGGQLFPAPAAVAMSGVEQDKGDIFFLRCKHTLMQEVLLSLPCWRWGARNAPSLFLFVCFIAIEEYTNTHAKYVREEGFFYTVFLAFRSAEEESPLLG